MSPPRRETLPISVDDVKEIYCFSSNRPEPDMVTVERGRPVLLHGPSVDEPEQEALIRRRARCQTGLHAHRARIRHFQRRWASCDAHDVLEFHPRVMALPSNVQDYVIVHELCHTVEKSHTEAFWALVARHMPDWHRHHEVLERECLETLYNLAGPLFWRI